MPCTNSTCTTSHHRYHALVGHLNAQSLCLPWGKPSWCGMESTMDYLAQHNLLSHGDSSGPEYSSGMSSQFLPMAERGGLCRSVLLPTVGQSGLSLPSCPTLCHGSATMWASEQMDLERAPLQLQCPTLTHLQHPWNPSQTEEIGLWPCPPPPPIVRRIPSPLLVHLAIDQPSAIIPKQPCEPSFSRLQHNQHLHHPPTPMSLIAPALVQNIGYREGIEEAHVSFVKKKWRGGGEGALHPLHIGAVLFGYGAAMKRCTNVLFQKQKPKKAQFCKCAR